MIKRQDISNLKFNRLLVVKYVGKNKHSHNMWECLCDCGNTTILPIAEIKSGHTKSCGCLSSENVKTINVTHGLSSSQEYKIWDAMKYRCLNTKNRAYKNYGGRGIKVCERWINSFENFISDMGFRPSKNHSIDRIDNNGNYEPSNCRWATKKQQSDNNRRNKKFTFKGITLVQSDWERRWKVKNSFIYNRLRKGHTFEELCTQFENTFISHSFGYIL